MKYLLFILPFFTIINLNAQIIEGGKKESLPLFIGIEKGFNLTTRSYEDNNLPNEFVGIDFDYFFKKNSSIKIEVKYLKVDRLTEMWDSDFDNITTSYSGEFIAIPILYKWQFGKKGGFTKAYVQGGVFFALETESEYINYPEYYDVKNNDYGLSLGFGTYFPIVKRLYVNAEIDLYKGFVSKVTKDEYEPPITVRRSLTNVMFSFGFKYEFNKY